MNRDEGNMPRPVPLLSERCLVIERPAANPTADTAVALEA